MGLLGPFFWDYKFTPISNILKQFLKICPTAAESVLFSANKWDNLTPQTVFSILFIAV